MDDIENKQYDIVLVKISNVEHITGFYGESGFSDQLSFIGHLLNGLNTSYYYCRVSATMFSILKPSNDNVAILSLIEEIKEHLQFNPPIKKVKYEFAYMKQVNHELTFSVVVNRLLSAFKTIENSYNVDVVEFMDSMLEAEEKKKYITSIMEESLKNQEFKVFYQPKHDTVSKQLEGFEALVRWFPKDVGFISPGDFIPVFESNGFITKLDLYMLETVLKDFVKLKEAGIKPCPVSINLSRRDLASVSLSHEILPLFEKYDVDKSLIHFEITESVCGLSDEVLNMVAGIKEAGIAIEIDDFGSGYSSLGIIDTIPMDYLKLDITFARNIEKKKTVIKTIIDLAHALNTKIVAEGVESEEQLKTYQDLGCDLIQGFYFSKAIPFGEYVDYLKKFENCSL